MKYVDLTGCFASTHTDSLGNVIAVFNDGDLGVYRHDTDANGVKQLLTNDYSITNTSAGGERMGETEYWDEFGDENSVISNSRIYYNTSWDNEVKRLNRVANSMSLFEVAIESLPNGNFDIKTNRELAPNGSGTGRLLRGKYATIRSAGNFLAGMNGATGTIFGKRISLGMYMRMAGALHWGTNKFATSIKPPYYGEIPYAGRMIIVGFNYGANNR